MRFSSSCPTQIRDAVSILLTLICSIGRSFQVWEWCLASVLSLLSPPSLPLATSRTRSRSPIHPVAPCHCPSSSRGPLSPPRGRLHPPWTSRPFSIRPPPQTCPV